MARSSRSIIWRRSAWSSGSGVAAASGISSTETCVSSPRRWDLRICASILNRTILSESGSRSSRVCEMRVLAVQNQQDLLRQILPHVPP